MEAESNIKLKIKTMDSHFVEVEVSPEMKIQAVKAVIFEVIDCLEENGCRC